MRINTPPLNEVIHVLVLDDELPVARAVARQLQDLSCAVHLATSVREAETLELAQQLDVALIDHKLAGSPISGLDYLTQLQLRNPYCYRIIFTGEANFDFAVEAINLGHVDAFLPKPWSEEQLHMQVHQGAQTAWLRQHNALLNEHLSEQNEQLNRFNAQLEELVLERTRKLEDANRRLEQANRELKAYQDELVRLETQAAVSQLVQGLAHELNNPLAVILGYAQRYGRRYKDDPKLDKCFRIIQEEGQRNQQLIAKLRKFIQRECDPPQHISLERLVNLACDRLLERREDALPCYLHGPVLEITVSQRATVQALEHILENAAEIPGATRVDISTEYLGERLRIHLDNDGQTPDDGAIRNAGKPFFTTKGVDHPGLGFSLAASLLGRQGCSLTLNQHPSGEGARVSLLMTTPSTLEHASNASSTNVDSSDEHTTYRRSTSRIRRAVSVQQATQGQLELLAVDDEPLILELVADTCRELGFAVHTADTLTTARPLVETHAIKALVIDAHLGDGDTEEFISRTLHLHPAIGQRILIVTGDPHSVRVEAMQRRFGCPVMGKPFRLHDLSEQLDSWR